jgi:hypothetical protein
MLVDGAGYFFGQCASDGNADLIAHAPTDLAALLDRVAELEREVERLRGIEAAANAVANAVSAPAAVQSHSFWYACPTLVRALRTALRGDGGER